MDSWQVEGAALQNIEIKKGGVSECKEILKRKWCEEWSKKDGYGVRRVKCVGVSYETND